MGGARGSPLSNCAPVHPAPCACVKNISGNDELIKAITATAPLATGFRDNNPKLGQIATSHGNPRVRLLIFMPERRLAERIESQSSECLPEFFARSAKSTAAMANTAPAASLAMLPAWVKKQYPAATSHIQCQAARGVTPRRVNKLKTNPGSNKKEIPL